MGHGKMSIYDEILYNDYEPHDYYEWFKENESLITATKFGLY